MGQVDGKGALLNGGVVASDVLVAERGDRALAVCLDVTEPAGTHTRVAWARIMATNLTGVLNGITAATESLKVSVTRFDHRGRGREPRARGAAPHR